MTENMANSLIYGSGSGRATLKYLFILISCLIIALAIVALPFISNYFYPKSTNQEDNLNIVVAEQGNLLWHQSLLIQTKNRDFSISVNKCNELLVKIDELVVINNKLRDSLKEQDQINKELEKELYLQRIIISALRNQQVKPDPEI